MLRRHTAAPLVAHVVSRTSDTEPSRQITSARSRRLYGGLRDRSEGGAIMSSCGLGVTPIGSPCLTDQATDRDDRTVLSCFDREKGTSTRLSSGNCPSLPFSSYRIRTPFRWSRADTMCGYRLRVCRCRSGHTAASGLGAGPPGRGGG